MFPARGFLGLKSLVVLLFLAVAPTGNVEAQTGGYQLGAGDRVRVIVFGEAELSGEFELDSEGMFSMPLIGTVASESLTPRELEASIATLFLDGFLKNPRISIEVLNYRPFYILGEVNAPGAYPFRAGMTILNAAVVAGGFTYRANEKKIEVTRGGASEPRVMAPNTIVQPGDIIRVKERFF